MDEVIDFVGCFVSTIEEYLVFLVQPRVREVLHANICPLVRHLPPTAIDDSGNLVRDNKLKVLRSKGVSYKQAVLYFYCSYHVVVH